MIIFIRALCFSIVLLLSESVYSDDLNSEQFSFEYCMANIREYKFLDFSPDNPDPEEVEECGAFVVDQYVHFRLIDQSTAEYLKMLVRVDAPGFVAVVDDLGPPEELFNEAIDKKIKELEAEKEALEKENKTLCAELSNQPKECR